MALYEFLDEHREDILRLTTREIGASSPKITEAQRLDSLPELFNDIVAALREDHGLARETEATAPAKSATVHGRQRLKLGFTILDLVHDYGALCMAITSVAEQTASFTPREYQILNEALDIAIAEAVSEYASQRDSDRQRASDRRAAEQLGFVAHEMRNALSAVVLSFQAIRRGQVAIGGRTSMVLERNLSRMQTLIDRSLAEVRLRVGAEPSLEQMTVRDLIEDVEIAIGPDTDAREASVVIEGEAAAQLKVDRPLITSALTNLVQNAIKYSPRGAVIHVRCLASERAVRVEVEDQCGGLPAGKVEQLFEPFARGTARDSVGIGLGLTIARRAVLAHGGRIDVRNMPGRGCVFSVELPRG